MDEQVQTTLGFSGRLEAAGTGRRWSHGFLRRAGAALAWTAPGEAADGFDCRMGPQVVVQAANAVEALVESRRAPRRVARALAVGRP